ncbi:MAG: leucine-rich repeat protein, partial [Bacilli bacterium]|nr:leucine-rich repeat protein [Bacilli bacterium]
FKNNWSLLSVTIPQSVASIGSSAFALCYKLFEICNLSSLDIAIGSTSNGNLGEYDKAVHTSATYASIFAKDDNGFVTYLDGETNLLMAYEGSLGDVNLPRNIDIVYRYALAGNPSIVNLVINEGTTEIGLNAFVHCVNLVSLSISSTVNRIVSAMSPAQFHPNFIEAAFVDPEGWSVEGSGSIDKVVLQDKTSAATKLLTLGSKVWTKEQAN